MLLKAALGIGGNAGINTIGFGDDEIDPPTRFIVCRAIFQRHKTDSNRISRLSALGGCVVMCHKEYIITPESTVSTVSLSETTVVVVCE